MAGRTSAPRPNLEHVARGAESRNFSFSDFQFFECAKVKLDKSAADISETHELSPACVTSFPTSRDRSVSVRDRVGFGSSSSGTNLLYVLGFYNVSGNINRKIRAILCCPRRPLELWYISILVILQKYHRLFSRIGGIETRVCVPLISPLISMDTAIKSRYDSGFSCEGCFYGSRVWRDYETVPLANLIITFLYKFASSVK